MSAMAGELDELREDHPSQDIPISNPLPDTLDSPTAPKRGRGRPKGSKNKKTIEAELHGPTPGASSSNQGEKRKRGRPPKNQALAASDKPPPKKRGRPPKNKQQPQGTPGGPPNDPTDEPHIIDDDDEEGDPKRLKSVEGS